MSTPRITDALDACTVLRAAGVRAYVDPKEAAANLPCVLFLPPLLRFDRHGGDASIDWRLAVLAEPPAGLDAWRQLDAGLAELVEHVAVIEAEPGTYSLSGERQLPAYLCTVHD